MLYREIIAVCSEIHTKHINTVCGQNVELLNVKISEEVRVTSGVPQGSVLGPLLFIAYVNDIWRYMESTVRLFADDCVIYRKIINNADMKKLQKDLDRLG